jgi:hypothetical protein
VLRSDGLPAHIRSAATTWDLAHLEETFDADSNRARWRSPSDADDVPLSARAFYWSVTGTAEDAALLARAALSRPDRSVTLLPAGHATAEVFATATLRHAGASQTVRLIAIAGIRFLPILVWLDHDGELFARGEPWFLIVRRGFEGERDLLLKYQQEAWSRWQASVRASAVQSRAGRVVIRDATVFDSALGRTVSQRRVVLKGARIAEVSEERGQPVAGATVIDADGHVLIPGLVDMHQHIGMADGLLDVASGVTTIRDPADDPTMLRDLKRRFDEGSAIGPRLFCAGLIEGKTPGCAMQCEGTGAEEALTYANWSRTISPGLAARLRV